MFRKVNARVATIGNNVKARKPTIQGEMKSSPWRASRRARGDERADGCRGLRRSRNLGMAATVGSWSTVGQASRGC
jgi:hypothetical protein